MARKGWWETQFLELERIVESGDKKRSVEFVFDMCNLARAFHYNWIAEGLYNKLKARGYFNG